jgi:hypothetical protein
MGFKSRKRTKAPFNNANDPKLRVSFVKGILTFIGPQRPKLFSDEKIFDCNDHGKATQWVKNGERPCVREFQKWSPKVHVWGLIGVGIRRLVFFADGEKIDQQVYKLNCLQRVLVPLMSAEGNKHQFQQDGARCHTAKTCLAYLASKNICVLTPWPARSPDLNPIEQLWAIIQKRVSERGPTEADELKRFVQEEWDNIPELYINNLVNSFRDRCEVVLSRKGAH